MQRWPLYLLAPSVAAIALAVLPLMLGERTLFLGDVVNLHLGVKAAQAQALAAGELPLVDMARTTGEPLLGNANGLPLYPTNLLYLVAPFPWAFNAHYWLHWLLAPFAFYWLGRRFGLSQSGASAGAVFWATSGFLVSQLIFYNLIAVMALAPACLASWLAAAEEPKFWPLSAVLLALLLVAGDPFSALLVLAMGALALLLRPLPAVVPGAPGSLDRHRLPWRGALLSFGAALLLASPGIVEMVRILPTSLRAVSNRDLETSLDHSLQWISLPDFVMPFFFGNWDFTSWGKKIFDGSLPFFPTFFPGLLALAAGIAAGRGGVHGRAWRWSLWLIGGGFFFALGENNPLVLMLYRWLPGMSVLRFPAKFVLPVALAVSLLGGIGLDRFVHEGEARQRALSRALGWLTGAYTALLVLLVLLPPPVGSWLERLVGEKWETERLRWMGTLLVLVGVGVLTYFCSRLSRRPLVAAALMLGLSTVVQLDFLRQLYRGGEMELLSQPPPALAALPPTSLIFHQSRNSLRLVLDRLPTDLTGPGNDLLRARCAAAELAPSFGVTWHRRYALAQTADYLDGLLGFFVSWRLQEITDRQLLAALTVLGVDHLLTTGELAPEAADLVEPVGAFTNDCRRELRVYRLRGAAPGAYLLPGNVRLAPDFDQAFASVIREPFDPRDTVLLSGQGKTAARPPGVVRVLEEGFDHFALEVESPAGGVLVARRNWLPFYRAWVDGEPARLQVANLMHLGLELPAGRHHVLVEADRRPTRAAFAAAGLSLLAVTIAFFRLSAKKAAPKNAGGSAGDA